MADSEHDGVDATEQTKQFIEARSIALLQQLSGFLEGRLVETPQHRVIASNAVATLLVRLLLGDCLTDPAAFGPSLALLDDLRRSLHDAFTAAIGGVPGESRH